MNGQAQGNVATTMLQNGFDVNALRPWIGKDGRSYISQNKGGKMIAVPTPVSNATLRKDEWQLLDEAIVRVSKERLRVVGDLRSAGLTFTIPNGMGKTVFQTETVSDITPATISMDPAREGEKDRPEFAITNLPLPVIHKDFSYTAREIATSRNTGASIDTTTAELAAVRVSEEAEKLVLGVSGASGHEFQYGGGTIYGYTNFPSRLTRTISTPTGSNQTTTVQNVLGMRQDSKDAFHHGPWVLYNSPDWDEFLDDDYSSAKGDNTLRQRLEVIDGIRAVRTADFLGTGFDLVLVQQSSDVARLVVGMDITTLQWETLGGLQLNFKVMAILVPQLRADFAGNTGIVHGSV